MTRCGTAWATRSLPTVTGLILGETSTLLTRTTVSSLVSSVVPVAESSSIVTDTGADFGVVPPATWALTA